MHHEVESLADPDAVARAGADFVAARARDAVATSGRFHFAVGGGHTPWAMFAELASQDGFLGLGCDLPGRRAGRSSR